ncbi:unnamed protein product [Amoebophrya sp. A120]|nr:unnamed protein product [Amoebophrya sp. A120]|eukprot:GSA120T00003534001.1
MGGGCSACCQPKHPVLTEVEDLVAEWQELKDIRYEKEILRKCLRIRSVREGELIVRKLQDKRNLMQARKMASSRGEESPPQTTAGVMGAIREEAAEADRATAVNNLHDEADNISVEEMVAEMNSLDPTRQKILEDEFPALSGTGYTSTVLSASTLSPQSKFVGEVQRRQETMKQRFVEREASLLPRYGAVNIHDSPCGRECNPRIPTTALIQRIRIEKLERDVRDWELATDRLELKSQAELLRLQCGDEDEPQHTTAELVGQANAAEHKPKGGLKMGWEYFKGNLLKSNEEEPERFLTQKAGKGPSLTQLLVENHVEYGLIPKTDEARMLKKRRSMDYVIKNFVVHDGQNTQELAVIREELAALQHDIEEIVTELRAKLRLLTKETILERKDKLRIIQKRELRRWKSLALADRAAYEGPVLAPTNDVILHPDNKSEYEAVRRVTVIYKNWDLLLKLKYEDDYFERRREARLTPEEMAPQEDDDDEPNDDD